MNVIDDMKKIIKKKKAFTLVELMGVLVIIGLLSIILIPVISNSIKNNKEKIYQAQLQNIVLAAKNFGSDNLDLLPKTEGDAININLKQLMMAGYIDFDIVNPKTKKNFPECLKIKITKVKNNHEYIIDESSIDSCETSNGYSDSKIALSLPERQYIKNQDEVSYILVVKPSQENQTFTYNLDSTKISLGEVSGATYYVEGSNGNYKITVVGGDVEETIRLKLNEGTIIAENGEIVDTSKLEFGTLIVDNTDPVITFSKNGNSDWEAVVETTINVTDARSGGDSSTYKYEFDSSTSYVNGWSFSDGETVSCGQGWEGDYYIKAVACDNAGNCAEEISNKFKIDSEPPYSPNVSLVYSGTSHEYNGSWTKEYISANLSSDDYGIGGVYYQYRNDDSVSWMDMNTFSTESEGEYNFNFRACDALNNCSYSTSSYWVGIDKTPPTITLNSSNASAWVGTLELTKRSLTNNTASFLLEYGDGNLEIERYSLFSCSDNSGKISVCDLSDTKYTADGLVVGQLYLYTTYNGCSGHCCGNSCKVVLNITAEDEAGNSEYSQFTYYINSKLW